MMKQLPQMETDAQIVSFSAGEEILNPRVMRWGNFMARRGGHAPKQYPDPDDLATIRYTSGTTGDAERRASRWYASYDSDGKGQPA